MRTRLRFETAYDVVVCGGGMAGVAAVLAAARLGQKTCLLEKTVFTGGAGHNRQRPLLFAAQR